MKDMQVSVVGCKVQWIAPMLVILSAVIGIGDTLTQAWVNSQGDNEYCETEIFQATCDQGEVIIMKSAKYGRMTFGRCVDRDWGYLGCFIDVLVVADQWCSGRRSCQIPIPNASFMKHLYTKTQCPRDLNPYFSASYQCVKVETADSQHCGSSSFILPSSPSYGIIANYVTMETDKGSDTCPWIIQAKHGQRVNITLLDFARSENDFLLPGAHDPGYDVCHVYAVLRERADRGVDRTEYSVCGGGHEREKTVYVTEGHSVEIKVVSYRSTEDLKYFLIRYEVTGCENPENIPNTWMKRMDQDQVMIGCRTTGNTWTIRCVNNLWEGVVGNCTQTHEKIGFLQLILSIFSLPIGKEYTLALVAGIALLIGIVIVTLGICCAKALCGKKSKKTKKPNRRVHSDKLKGKPVQEVHPTTKVTVPNTDSSEHLIDNRSSDLDIQSNILPPPPAFIMDGAPTCKEKDEMPPPPPPSTPPMTPRQLPNIPNGTIPPPSYDSQTLNSRSGQRSLSHTPPPIPGNAPPPVDTTGRCPTPDLLLQQSPNLLLQKQQYHPQHKPLGGSWTPPLSTHHNHHQQHQQHQQPFESNSGNSNRRFGHRRMPSDVAITIERSPVHMASPYKTYNPRSGGYQSNSHPGHQTIQHHQVPRSAGYQPNPHSSFEFPPPPPPEVLRQMSEPGVEKHRVRFQDIPNGSITNDNSDKNKYQGLHKQKQPKKQDESNGIINIDKNASQSYGSFSSRILNLKPPTEETLILDPRHSGDEKTYFELEPEGGGGVGGGGSAVPYEYGYSVKTGQKFKLYHGDQIGNKHKTRKVFDKSPKKPRVITNSTV